MPDFAFESTTFSNADPNSAEFNDQKAGKMDLSLQPVAKKAPDFFIEFILVIGELRMS